jgi:hypothetical protein
MTSAAAHSASSAQGALEAELRQHMKTLKHDRHVIRFFKRHRWLLTDPRFANEARTQLSAHRTRLALTMRRLTATRAAIERRTERRQLALAQLNTPKNVICRVFGSYCREALTVARCESNLQTWARNGQYLGLFQMGSYERRLFGHGPNARQQARAALRYFVRSGRDWSPWPVCGRLV